jgi:hypothetical protein
VNGSFERLKLAQIGGRGAFCEGKVRDDMRWKKWSWWAMGSSDLCVWLRSSPSPDRTSDRGFISLRDEWLLDTQLYDGVGGLRCGAEGCDVIDCRLDSFTSLSGRG